MELSADLAVEEAIDLS